VEGELWQLRQEQLAKQQEFERVYSTRLEAERKKFAEETEAMKTSLERSYENKVEELEKRERSTSDELKKQEAVLKWAKDSWNKETGERERALKQKDLDIDKKLLEKNQEIEEYKVKVSLLEKQLGEYPEAMKRRDEDLSRYKDAIGSLEGVIRSLEAEKKNQGADYETKMARLSEALEAEKSHYREMEAEIPKRLKIAVEHERNRFAEKLQEVERDYHEDLGKRRDEVDYLQRNLKTFEETIKTIQSERDAFANKVEQMQTQYNVKLEEFAFREKQLQSEYDVRLKVEMEKHTGALRSEIEASGRIYEDSLRLKVEEISHLRREMEELSKEKAAGKEQLAALRRQLEAAEEHARSEQDALRARLKSELEKKLSEDAIHWEKRSSAEKQRFSAELEGRIAEFSGELSRKDDEINSLRLMLNKAGEEMKLARQKAAEELRDAVGEERARGAAELQDKLSGMADTLRLRDEKIAELSRVMEASKLEREELVLLERERLQRMYSEKEKAMDEELLHAREALTRAESEKGALVSSHAAERQALEEKLAAVSARLSEETAASGLKIEAAVRRETERYAQIIERKNAELDAAAQLRQTQDEAYRKTLEDFRSKLSEALGKFESLKKTAEERQGQLFALQAELSQEKKRNEDQGASLSQRLADKEKLYKALRDEYGDFKAAFEESVKQAEKKYSEAMFRVHGAEEQKASRDKQIDAIKRDNDLLRAELLRKDQEVSDLKSGAGKNLEAERREMHSALERRALEFAQREKSLLAEISALRDITNAKDIQFEKQKAQAEEAVNNAERLKAIMNDERSAQAESEMATRALREDYEKRLREMSLKEKALSAELLGLKNSLAGKSEEVSDQNSEIEALRHAVERLKAAFSQERTKRVESELLAETSRSALLEKQEEFLRTQKLVEQLKENIKSWKSK
jgi:chromosome segregation ATPase